MSGPATRRKPIAPRRVDLGVRVGPLTLRNPVLTASGTFGYGDEYAHVVDLSTIGGVVTKTVTVMPRPGNAPARVAETPAGMLNSIGLENVGLERFVADKLPRLAALSPGNPALLPLIAKAENAKCADVTSAKIKLQ